MNKQSFEKAFDPGRGSSVAACECGKVFYNSNGGWDWEDGELEKLHEDPTAVDLDWSVGYVCFEGSHYVSDCKCWTERAEKIMAFLDGHEISIANYLNLEKQRKITEANMVPDV